MTSTNKKKKIQNMGIGNRVDNKQADAVCNDNNGTTECLLASKGPYNFFVFCSKIKEIETSRKWE
jgi:hypothetical protein